MISEAPAYRMKSRPLTVLGVWAWPADERHRLPTRCDPEQLSTLHQIIDGTIDLFDLVSTTELEGGRSWYKR